MEVFLAEPGSRVHVRRNSLYITLRDGKRIPLTADVTQIIIASSRISISSKAVRIAAKMGIDIVFLDGKGDVVARLYPPVINKTVSARVGQYLAFNNQLAGIIASEIVYSKIYNQAQVIKYIGKSRRDERIVEAGREIEYIGTEVQLHSLEKFSVETLMNIEAKAAKRYWSIVAEILPSHLGFNGRNPDSLDPFNIALNYGYGILYAECDRALVLAGLDPYLGLLHTLKSGKPSLTLDFMEMFRSVVVDKGLIINASNLKVDIINGLLSYESRKLIASIVLEALNRVVRSSKRSRSLKLRDHIRLEAYDLADAFRSQTPYVGFRVRF